MNRVTLGCVLTLVFSTALAESASAQSCSPDSVRVGTVCVDRYEASAWQISPTKKALLKKVRDGRASKADLLAGGAVQLAANEIEGDEIVPYPPSFPQDGNWTPLAGSDPPTPGIYAVAIPGVPGSTASWFQAAQLCTLSGKRLLTNHEWQIAAAGTPESVEDDGATTCSTVEDYYDTGSRSKCVSSWGVFDMEGALSEWVADWGTVANFDNCTTWLNAYGPDFTDWFPTSLNDGLCFGGVAPGEYGKLPAAWARRPGVLSIDARFSPAESPYGKGFRCGR